MDIASFLGYIIGTVCILYGCSSEDGMKQMVLYIDIPSAFIVFGGTVGTTLINFTLSDLKGLGKVIGKIFTEETEELNKVISTIVSFAEKARKEGLLTLEDDIEQIDDQFMKKGIQLVIDGTEPEVVKIILNTEKDKLEDRHKKGQAMITSMGTYAPAFGMIGTLIGLISMLANLSDPSALGPGMAKAIVTTFYGAVLANFMFLPAADNLSEKNNNEVLSKEIIVEGLISIQAGDNPRLVEEKLRSFLPPALRESSEEEGDDD